MVDAAEALDVFAVFASADEATKPIEASDNVNASNFFISLSPLPKKISQARRRHVQDASAGELDLICKTPIKSEGLQLLTLQRGLLFGCGRVLAT
jgi:hypothetical protein